MKKFIKSFFASWHKGLSLVELIVSVAILGVVGTVAASAMFVSSNQYTRGAAEVNIQNEAQLALNLISDKVIDATSVTDDGSKLTITKGSDTFVVEYDSGQNALLYTYNTEPTAILCGCVTDFSFVNTFADNRNVTFSVKFESNGRTYNAVTDTTSRNYSFTASSFDALADNLIITYDIPGDDVYMEPGMTFGGDQDYKFNATVYGAYSGISSYGLDTLDNHTLTLTNGTDSSVVLKIDDAAAGTTTYPITVTTSSKASGVFTTTVTFKSNNGVVQSRALRVLIRRVAEGGFKFNGADASNISQLSALPTTGTTGTEDSKYTANLLITVDNATYNFGASYDNGAFVYMDPTKVYYTYAVKNATSGAVIANDATVKSEYIKDLVEVTSGTPSSSFTLKKDLEDGEVLYVYAHSLHSVGYDSSVPGTNYNKAANIINGSTGTNPKCYTNSGSQYIAIATVRKINNDLSNVGAGFQRGAPSFLVAELSDETYAQLVNDGLMRTNGDINYVVSIRYKVLGATNWVQSEDHPYVLSITTTDPTSDPNGVFSVDGTFTSLFDCSKAYELEVSYSLYVAPGKTVTVSEVNDEGITVNHTYTSGERIRKFTSTGDIPAVSNFVYNSSTNYFQNNIGTEANPVDFTSYPKDPNNSNITLEHYMNIYNESINVKGYLIQAPDGIERLVGGSWEDYATASIGKVETKNDRQFAPNESDTISYQDKEVESWWPLTYRTVTRNEEVGVIRFGSGSGNIKYVGNYNENQFPDPCVTYSTIQLTNYPSGTYRVRLAVNGYDGGGRYVLNNGTLPSTSSPSGSEGSLSSPSTNWENLGYVYFKT
jgi:prepilin-type N-terminal cleavage/methylation domain-containing protein